ncbi:HmuY family protein [Marinobacter fonticola]|uniref:HmuY family protein n=1 Tax=Marinobacter fonticola TaxID=2603215 RepID=UPI0011E6BEAC|nr:HmuY family protein [Marinobacter fonticola]
MIQARSILSLAVAAILLAGCGGGSSNDIGDDSGESDQGESSTVDDQQAGVATKQLDASDSATPVFLNLETGQTVELTAEEAATSTAWHLAFRRNNIQLNSGASGPGNVVGAIGAGQADFYDSNGEPSASVFLNATADSELEHLLAEMAEPSSWTRDELISGFAEDWYTYDARNGNITANSEAGWLVRSGEGNSYARMRVTSLDFPTRTGEGIKAFTLEFDVQPAGALTFADNAALFSGSIPATGGESCFDFDANAKVACDDAAWDITIGFAGRDFYLRTNSGPSGEGEGGVFGPHMLAELASYTNGTTSNADTDISHHYTADSTGGIFVMQSWYAYSLQGAHKLWPNYRVYLIDTDSTNDTSPVYGLQVIGYYNDAGASGFPNVRWKTVELTAAE